jgi:peptide-methionine (S)-S-oxide reductase
MRRLLLSLALILATAGFAVAQMAPLPKPGPGQAVATFAGGCFWCTESDFDHVPGVISTTSGYSGGRTAMPDYRQVSAGGTGHAEAVEVIYDPSKVSYATLLDHYWRSVDPTVKNAQFCDRGDQYRSAIFVRSDDERKLAEASKKKVEAQLKVPIYTQIVKAGVFYPAEEYHQDFYQKNSVKYKFYRWNCGRDQRLKQIWGASKGDK